MIIRRKGTAMAFRRVVVLCYRKQKLGRMTRVIKLVHQRLFRVKSTVVVKPRVLENSIHRMAMTHAQRE